MSANRDITVVVPCFDSGPLVHEAVDSALEQEGGGPRVVVVDDGSSDPDTLTALEDLPPAVEVLRQENAGLSAARNAGVERSPTDLFLMLDADDRLHPTALRRLRAVLDEDRDLGFAYGIAEFFGAWGGELRFPAWDPYRLLYRSTVTMTALIRRELFDAVGGVDTELAGYEDWDFFLGAAERGWAGRLLPEVTFYYRRSEGGLVRSTRREYRRHYRYLRSKHRELYRRRRELAAQSDAGPLERLVYRTWFAWRPLPAALEHRLYRLLFRRSRASSISSDSRAASRG